ncbi:MAG TPA: xanthine dehydrogenase family protein molybdopterin-binding subunit [Candidatus Binatia bacterium]
MSSSVIGRALPRIEGESKVTGASVYSADVTRPGTLWSGYLRSPYPHARIVRIDTSRALKLPGIKAIVTGQDVSPKLEGCVLRDKPVLAQDRVRYIGEKVAALAAVTKDDIEEALDLIEVEYEELPAVFDPLEAMKPDAPILHPDYASYQGINKDESWRNVRSAERSSKGDIDRGFAESDRIFEHTFRTQSVHQGFVEPRAGVLEIDAQGRVAIWQCHQAPFLIRTWLAAHADLPEEMVVVNPVSTGGSFGGKQGSEDIICTYYLARASGRPVKYVESYSEELQDGQPRHSAVVTLRTGVKNDGRMWAWDGRVFYNGGAYGARTPRNGMNGTFCMAGSYRTPHVRMVGYIVYTNQVPSGYFRAPGELQTLFAAESHVDMMAKELRMDPLEFRLLNALREGDTKPTGKPLSDPCGVEVLERLGKLFKRRKPGVESATDGRRLLVGRGFSLGDRHIGSGESSAKLFLEADGSLRLATAVRDVGVGAYTMHRQVVAEVLGVEPEAVAVAVGGTDTGPYDEGVRGQRGTHIEGLAVERAANALIEELKQRAAGHWEVEKERVRWERGRAWLAGPKKRSLALRDIARLSANGLPTGFGHCKGGEPHVYAFQAMMAEVEVDQETGQVTVRSLNLAHDVTRIINPLIYQGQIEGAVMQGFGFTLSEQLGLEDGRVTTLSFGDYKIPTFRDIPALTTSRVQAKEGPGPFGAKAVAECGIGLVAPAVANAVCDATGVRITELPITPEKILKGLAASRGR